MTDREMLEFAAKAAGITVSFDRTRRDWAWNSLDDDGDALRLAVKLDLTVMIGAVRDVSGQLSLDKSEDDLEATRRAIVRAAAEIGRNME